MDKDNHMDNIIRQILSLHGVRDACIYNNGITLASTLSTHQQEEMQIVLQVIEQLFKNLNAAGKNYTELCFTFFNQLILIYKFCNNCMVLLITDKKIHMPMIQMGVKAATRHIQAM